MLSAERSDLHVPKLETAKFTRGAREINGTGYLRHPVSLSRRLKRNANLRAVRSSRDSARLEQLLASLPEPAPAMLDERGYNIMVAGIGGIPGQTPVALGSEARIGEQAGDGRLIRRIGDRGQGHADLADAVATGGTERCCHG